MLPFLLRNKDKCSGSRQFLPNLLYLEVIKLLKNRSHLSVQ